MTAGSPIGTTRCLDPLPVTVRLASGLVELVEAEGGDLAGPEAGGVHELEHGAVADPESPVLGFRGASIEPSAS